MADCTYRGIMTLKIDLSNHGFTKDTSIAQFKLYAEYNTSDEQEKAIEKLKLQLENCKNVAFSRRHRFRQNICHGQSD